MLRIYCDANARDEHNRYILAITGALRDIEPIADKLRIGMHVILYEDEYEVEAVLDLDHENNIWVASAIWSTIRYFPREGR